MSDVWLGRHHVLATPVVVKTMKPDVGAPGDRHARMVAEARLMAHVTSPRVVRALDVGLAGDTPYLVQEYVDGVDLAELDRLRRRALGLGLPLWFVCAAIAQAADGLHAAHHSGVLHRDVKPSNLLLAPTGGDGLVQVRLADFGIAVAGGSEGCTDTTPCGTVRFMAPEAVRGLALDRRTDVFSLGATALDLRYGSPPYPDLGSLLAGAAPVIVAPATPHEAFFQAIVRPMINLERDDRPRDLRQPLRLLRSLAQEIAPSEGGRSEADGSIDLRGIRLHFQVGDIAGAEADGILNSAPSEMTMRTGVGNALRAAGGDSIEREACEQGHQPLGACLPTKAGRLRARYVLHAVSAWQEASCIARATQRALLLAEELGLRTLAAPAVGTGQARVGIEACARAFGSALALHAALGGSRLQRIDFVLSDERKRAAFRETIAAVLLGRELHGDAGLSDPNAHRRDAVSTDGATCVAALPNS
jgi:serine/threonine-protein kinase